MKLKSKSALLLKILFTALTLILIGFIFSNSVKTADASSASSGRVVAFLNGICKALSVDPFFTQEIVRPLAHFCEFGLLGVLSLITAFFYFGVKVKTLISSAIILLFTALTDECIQLFSDGRAFQFTDLVIDLSGGLIGLVGTFLIVLLTYNHKKKASEKES